MLHCAYDDDDIVIWEVTTNDRNQSLGLLIYAQKKKT